MKRLALTLFLFFLIGCQTYVDKPITDQETSLDIELKTDKWVYTKGEPITLFITNNLERNITLHSHPAQLMGASLLQFSSGKWYPTSIFGDWCPCGAECYPNFKDITIVPGQTISDKWNQALRIAHCKLNDEIAWETKFKEPGKYMFILQFTLDTTRVTMYSNEFEIKN